VSLPTVSVVIPALNAQSWIATTLQSVLEQTYPKELIEIVIVDDGSVDGTVEEAERVLAAGTVARTVLRTLSSSGPGAARNRGWKHARGQWIQFLDADDLLHPQKIEVQATRAVQANPNTSVIYSPWTRLVFNSGTWSPAPEVFEPHIGGDPIFELLLSENFIATGSQLFRRTELERVDGYNESHQFVEDVELLLRIAFGGGCFERVTSSQPLFFYRTRPDSLSRSDDRAFIEGCVRNARLAERYWTERHRLTRAEARILAEVYFVGARFYSGRDQDAFNELVGDIYRLDPNFVPREPRALRILTKLLGYPRAERCAVQYRRFKRSFGPQAAA
jgi:glycosyltransferase involved in cell wall biosynthesis